MKDCVPGLMRQAAKCLAALVITGWLTPLAAAQSAAPSPPAEPPSQAVPSAASAAPTAGSGLRGAVHDAQGQPVIGAWLEVRPLTQGAITAEAYAGAPSQSMRSGENGRWEFTGLAAGTWLLTAVASTSPAEAGAVPLSDEQWQQMARPGADYRVPEGVAVTRIVRRFDASKDGMTELMDLGLALGPRPARPLLGQLVGGYDPDTYAYEVQLLRTSMTPGGVVNFSSVTELVGGNTSATSTTISSGSEADATTGVTTTWTSTSVDGVSDPPAPLFSVVPDRDGLFDFGSLKVEPTDLVSVVTVPLAGPRGAGNNIVYSSLLAVFEPWPEGIAISVAGQRTMLLKAVTADGKSPTHAPEEKIWCDLWGDGNRSENFLLEDTGSSGALPTGTYIARARLGTAASPLVAFTVTASGGSAEVSFVLQPCPPFTVNFVDGKGAPLGESFMKLGTAASKDFPEPCRVTVRLENGTATLEDLLPGTYLVEFSSFGSEAFTQQLELKPGDKPVVVNVP